MFAQATGRAANPWTISVSVALQMTALTAAIILPMLRIEALPSVRLQERSRVPDHIKVVPVTQAAKEIIESIARQVRLTYPRYVPKEVARVVDSRPIVTDLPPGIGQQDGDTVIRNTVLIATDGPINAAAPKPPEKPVEKPAVSKPATPVENKVYTIGGDVRPPVLKSAPPPPYPPLARAARIQGTVVMNGVISRDGTVKSLRVESGHPLLVDAAVRAVQHWLYEPGKLNGTPVDVALRIDVNFRLGQ